MTHRSTCRGALWAALLACISASTLAQGFGQEAPPIVIKSDKNMGTVWAGERSSAPPKNSSTQLLSAGGGGTTGAMTNGTGANVLMNQATIAQPSAIVTQGDVKCDSLVGNWNGADGVSVCSAPLPESSIGSSLNVTDSTAPRTGTATFVCNTSTRLWTPTGTPTCATTCAGGPLSWVGSATCSASFPSLVGAGVSTLASTNGNSGSATASCNASTGLLYISGNHGCTPPPTLGCNWPSSGQNYASYIEMSYVSSGARDNVTNTHMNAGYNTAPYGTRIDSVDHGGAFWHSYSSSHRSRSWMLRYTCDNGWLRRSSGIWEGGAGFYNMVYNPNPMGSAMFPLYENRNRSSNDGTLWISAPSNIWSPR